MEPHLYCYNVWATDPIDFCDEDQSPDEFAAERGVSAEVLEEKTETSWPVVVFLGTKSQLTDLIRDFEGL